MKKELLDIIKRSYPKGTRVVLEHMDDIQAPPKGTKGTVIGVDDIGSILVDWDNGSSLNVVYGEDRVEIVRHCCICGDEIDGYGNSPAPIAGKCCCDKCNNNVVVPYRVFLNNLGKNNCGLWIKENKLELITPKKKKFSQCNNFSHLRPRQHRSCRLRQHMLLHSTLATTELPMPLQEH